MRKMFGFVERIKRATDYARGYVTIIVTELGDRQLTGLDETGPFCVEVGTTTPYFPRSKKERRLAVPGDEVILFTEEVCRQPKIQWWGFADAWRQAEAEIAARPIYRVIRDNRFKGQMMPGELRATGDSARNEVVFTGNLQQLLAQGTRDMRESTRDKFAPVYRTGPITARNAFEVKVGSEWKPCDDPRPFPQGPIYRLMGRKGGKIIQLAAGTSLELNWKYERGPRDPLVQQAGALAEFDHLYWERYTAVVPQGESHWTEVLDPRPQPAPVTMGIVQQTLAPAAVKVIELVKPVVPAKVAVPPITPKATVAVAPKPKTMPKQAPRPLSRSVGLSELAELFAHPAAPAPNEKELVAA